MKNVYDRGMFSIQHIKSDIGETTFFFFGLCTMQNTTKVYNLRKAFNFGY